MSGFVIWEISERDTGEVLIVGTRSYIAENLFIAYTSVSKIIKDSECFTARRLENKMWFIATKGDERLRMRLGDVADMLGVEKGFICKLVKHGRSFNGWTVEHEPLNQWHVDNVRDRYDECIRRYKANRVKESKQNCGNCGQRDKSVCHRCSKNYENIWVAKVVSE